MAKKSRTPSKSKKRKTEVVEKEKENLREQLSKLRALGLKNEVRRGDAESAAWRVEATSCKLQARSRFSPATRHFPLLLLAGLCRPVPERDEPAQLDHHRGESSDEKWLTSSCKL